MKAVFALLPRLARLARLAQLARLARSPQLAQPPRLARVALLTLLPLLALSPAPCLWDSDTLDTELRGLPDAFDLVVGRWHRHSDAFYEHRIAQLIDKQPMQLADYDDLAVAYEHLQRRDLAIAVMQRKAAALAATPDEEHQYRYHANLGTFYAHQGKFEAALVELKTAIRINPDAHFGREQFQIALIDYAATASKYPEVWVEGGFLAGCPIEGLPRWTSLSRLANATPEDVHRSDWGDVDRLDWQTCHTAVAGMLRFGGIEGAELYRALGDLYLQRGHLNLAWWACSRAIERGHPAAEMLHAARESLEHRWNRARLYNNTGHVNPTQADYDQARRSADAWLAEFQQAEAAAIARGEDVGSDETLQRLLAKADEIVPRYLPRTTLGVWTQLYLGLALSMLVACLLKWLDKQAEADDSYPREIPPLWLAGATFVMVALDRLMPIWHWLPAPWRSLGWIGIALGALLVAGSALRLVRLGTGVHPFSEATAVVTTGAFRWTRNPMYLGMVTIAAGIAVRLGSVTAMVPPVLLLLVLDRRFVRREERFLEESLGGDYERYRAQVPRWLP